MNRIEYVCFFDVSFSNPNGDPDFDDRPRIDDETNHGVVTDVCLKRKMRDYVSCVKQGQDGFGIYFTNGVTLNQKNKEAWEKELPDKKLSGKEDGKKLPKGRDGEKLTDFMCRKYFDIRTFGAVMTTEINCGQVIGPVQVSFAHSVHPIFCKENTITRKAITNEKDATKQGVMGRKYTVPYGLYRFHVYFNPFRAERTGFNDSDLAEMETALTRMFWGTETSSKTGQGMRRVFKFEHASKLGNAHAHEVFDCVTARLLNSPPRAFTDCVVEASNPPEGVKFEILL